MSSTSGSSCPRGSLCDVSVTDRADVARVQQGLDAQAIGQQLRPWDAMLSAVRDLVCVFDLSGRVRYANHAALHVLQRMAEATLGSSFQELGCPPELAERLQQQLQGVVDTGRLVEAETPFDTAAVGTRHYEYVFSPVLSDAGQVVAVAGVARDVTEHRQARQRMDEFLATLGHELRNPLAPIRNSLAALRMSGAVDPAAERLQRTIERQVEHLVHLVDDLVDASRVSRGSIELRRERTALAVLVEAAAELCRPLIEARGQRLSVVMPPEPTWLDVDPMRVAQALANVLDNAARYTPHGGKIDLHAWHEADEAVISVRDDGLGIEAQLLPRVFDLFTQAVRGQHGLGLGLTVSQRLVQLHDGTIEAKSAGLGKGSEFVVRLPLAAETGESRPVRTPEASPTPRRRILVVDDNRDGADSLALLLELDGHEVRAVYDGASALQELERQEPDVVLLDIAMPDMDGHEVARRIRARAGGARLILVALSGWGQSQDRSRSTAAGFDHHLVKPVAFGSVEALLATLDRRP
jgi:PAS domain S-box-containing protein